MTGSNRGLQGLTEGYKGLQGVKMGLQRNTRRYTRLHVVTGGYKGLEKVTKS